MIRWGDMSPTFRPAHPKNNSPIPINNEMTNIEQTNPAFDKFQSLYDLDDYHLHVATQASMVCFLFLVHYWIYKLIVSIETKFFLIDTTKNGFY